MQTILGRIVGAARLDGTTYEGVEANPHTISGAVLVVLLSSVAAALGSGVTQPVEIAAVTLAAFVTWMVWVGLTYVIGTTVLTTPETHTTIGEVLRTTGFSAAPGILRVFGTIPVVGWPIFMGATIWMLFAFVVAIRHALDLKSAGRAFLVCFLGWLIHAIIFFGFVISAV
jgi:hypothetical protein